jgi:signal transduction histidine kinase
VGNAVKFSSPGSDVTVQYLKAAHGNGFRIIDSGIGISSDQIGSAFEPFSQLHTGANRQYEGTGLGLPLVRRFMDLHGGTISIRSQPGKGTIVSVVFPSGTARPTPPPASR